MHLLTRTALVAVTALGFVAVLVAGAITAASPARAATNGTMVSFGDSVPSGSRCSCTPFPAQYASRVAAHTDRPVRMTNLAFAGATSATQLRQLDTVSVRRAVQSANTAILMVGANDFSRAFNRVLHHRQHARAAYRPVAGRVQRNITTSVRTIQSLRPGIKVLVIGYWNVVEDGDVGRAAYGRWGMSMADRATSSANAAVARAARAAEVTYVSTYEPFRGTHGRANPTRLLASDGDHPNARGHALIATTLYRAAPRG